MSRKDTSHYHLLVISEGSTLIRTCEGGTPSPREAARFHCEMDGKQQASSILSGSCIYNSGSFGRGDSGCVLYDAVCTQCEEAEDDGNEHEDVAPFAVELGDDAAAHGEEEQRDHDGEGELR